MAFSNVALALWFLVDAVRCARGLIERPQLSPEVLLVLSFFALAVFSIARPRPLGADLTSREIVATIFSVTCPMLHLLAGIPEPRSAPSAALEWAGALGLLSSALAIREAFAVFPAYRGLVTKGPYRVVRHPMYASCLLAELGLCWDARSYWVGLVWCLETLLVIWRSQLEEDRLCRLDARYAVYCGEVRYRFMPLVY